MFAAYVSEHGHAFIDRQLYLPKSWAVDPERRVAAHVPDSVAFATKPAIAAKMIKDTIAADMPFSWVAGDSIYGVGEIEMLLRRAGKGYVLGVAGSHRFWSWSTKLAVAGTATAIAHTLNPADWQRLSAGPGTKGERMSGYTTRRILSSPTSRQPSSAPTYRVCGTGGLLIHRSIVDASLLHNLVPGRHRHRDAREARGQTLGNRGCLRDREERARA